MSVTHGMFCLERTYDAPPARVFAAFATEEGKSRWFSGSNDAWDQVHRAFDFRVGGREALEGKWKTGMISRRRTSTSRRACAYSVACDSANPWRARRVTA